MLIVIGVLIILIVIVSLFVTLVCAMAVRTVLLSLNKLMKGC